MARLRVAAIQHDIAWQDSAATHDRLDPLIELAAAGGAGAAVFTEMFATGFAVDADSFAQAPDGPSAMFLRDRARRHGLWLLGSIAVRDPGEDRLRNRFYAVAPDGRVVTYDKRHPFTFGGEHHRFASGDSTVTFDLDGVRVSPFVCYDLRFADDFWALATTTDLYVVVANWPAPRREHWSTLLRARAIENQAYVVGVNRVGSADGLDYVGDSAIIDPLGNVLTSAWTEQTVLMADVDTDRVTATRERFPFLADRRV